ncbi:hypothetical protein ACHQM5_018737 [Ranunculus cassubicifolius]
MKISFGYVLLFLLLIFTHEEMEMVDAEKNYCLVPRGICWSKSKCETTCINEGFTGGSCHGWRRRCYCFNEDCD